MSVDQDVCRYAPVPAVPSYAVHLRTTGTDGDDMMVTDDATRFYRGEAGESYHQAVHGTAIENEELYELKAELARRRYFTGLSADAKVFEFGVGTGMTVAHLDAAEVVGWDLSEAARTIARAHGVKVVDELADVPDDHFDVVACRHVLEHVPDPSSTLRRLASKVAADGRVLLILPVETGRLRPRHLPPSDADHHLYGWRLHHIRNLAESVGLEIVDFTYEWYSMQRLLGWVRRWLGFAVYDRAVTVAGHFRRQSEMVLWLRRRPSG